MSHKITNNVPYNVYSAYRCNMNGDKSTFSLLFMTITGTQINSDTGYHGY